MVNVQPGDVLCTRNDKGWAAKLIRIGAAIRGLGADVNHVAVVHHTDAAGTLWGVEARPGSVGWVDMRKYVASPWTIDNREQPKTDAQRAAVCAAAEGMLGTPYSWVGIAKDAMEAISAQDLWHVEWGEEPPAQVVCSSLATWCYHHVGLAAPKDDSTCTPGDWAEFIVTKGWAA